MGWHLKENAFTSAMYAWPLVKTLLTEVLQAEDWLKLMDYLFTYKEDPELFSYFCASYLLQSRGHLLQINSIEGLHAFFSKTTGLAFNKIAKMALKLHSVHKNTICLGVVSSYNLPICKDGMGEYPIFNRYPEVIVSY